MLSLGAKSTTFDELMEGLGFNLTVLPAEEIHACFHHLINVSHDPNRDVQLSTGNALFIQEALKVQPKFLEDVKNYYESEAFSTDFVNGEEAKKQVNDYVEKKTHGKIVDLVENLDPATVMLLVNYFFFKGQWEKPFNPNFTAEEDFFVDESTVVKVPMMHQYGRYNSGRDKGLGCTLLQIHYAGNVSALFVLPDEGKMKQVEAALSGAKLRRWMYSLSQGIVNLYLPRLSISATTDLKEVLTKMGIIEVFTNSADLSGITGHKDLKVSKAVHKAALSIDEEGTEAAGATALEMMRLSFVFPTKFNRPFLIFIFHHATRSIPFMGRIVNPTKV